jgi:hypothetical protein
MQRVAISFGNERLPRQDDPRGGHGEETLMSPRPHARGGRGCDREEDIEVGMRQLSRRPAGASVSDDWLGNSTRLLS